MHSAQIVEVITPTEHLGLGGRSFFVYSVLSAGLLAPICLILWIVERSKISPDQCFREGYYCRVCNYKFIPDPNAKPIEPNEERIRQAYDRNQQAARYYHMQQ